MDCSPPGSSVHGITQTRLLEWVAISYSGGIFLIQGSNLLLLHWQVDILPLSHQGSPDESIVSSVSQSVQSLSHVQLFATPWTTACQASLSITNSQSLLKLIFIESVMPSNHLILCLSPSPPAFSLSQHQGLFQ